MEHYLEFAPRKRITRASFHRRDPIKSYSQPITTPWTVELPHGSLPKLIMGFEAIIMDHKWHVYSNGPDDDGLLEVHFLRSWSGNPIVTTRIQTEDSQLGDGEEQLRGKIVAITWETDARRGPFPDEVPTEESAQKWVVDVCDWVFGIAIPWQGRDDDGPWVLVAGP